MHIVGLPYVVEMSWNWLEVMSVPWYEKGRTGSE